MFLAKIISQILVMQVFKHNYNISENQYMIIASVITSITSHLLVVILVATVIKKEWYSEMMYVYISYKSTHRYKATLLLYLSIYVEAQAFISYK